MYKLAGSILVLLGCAALGFQKASELQIHMGELETLKQIFILIKNEMEYTRSTLGDVFGCIGKRTEGKFNEWLMNLARNMEKREQGTFVEIWEKSVWQLQRKTYLTKEEIVELLRVGRNLSSLESIDLYLGQIDVAIEKARGDLEKKRKMYQSIGLLGGIFVVIILL